MIKSTLSSLPTFFFLVTLRAHRFEKLKIDSLWSGLVDAFKFHLVSWKTIYESVPQGGLGIQSRIKFLYILDRRNSLQTTTCQL